MSQILDIYAALAAADVTVDGITPTVRTLGQLKNAVEGASLPLRLLLPVNARSEAQRFDFVALGTTATVRWQITDLLLWRPVPQGLGLESVAETLVGYAGAYVEMLRQLRAPLASAQAAVESAQATPDVIEWPVQSGRWYFGVECQLVIEEVLSG